LRDGCWSYGCPQEGLLKGHQKWYYGENPGSAVIYIKTIFAGFGSLT